MILCGTLDSGFLVKNELIKRMSNRHELENIPYQKRDADWVSQYALSLESGSLKVMNPQPQQGPDGFSYLLLTAEGGEEPLADLVQWGADRGVGLVINPHKANPDLVITYGMLWNYLINKEFLSPMSTSTEKNFDFKPNQEVLTGVPNESYWPARARKLFKEFLIEQGIIQARIILILDNSDQDKAELCFSIESLGNPPQKEWAGILEAFSWFFPRHYSLALVSEKNLPTAPFQSI